MDMIIWRRCFGMRPSDKGKGRSGPASMRRFRGMLNDLSRPPGLHSRQHCGAEDWSCAGLDDDGEAAIGEIGGADAEG